MLYWISEIHGTWADIWRRIPWQGVPSRLSLAVAVAPASGRTQTLGPLGQFQGSSVVTYCDTKMAIPYSRIMKINLCYWSHTGVHWFQRACMYVFLRVYRCFLATSAIFPYRSRRAITPTLSIIFASTILPLSLHKSCKFWSFHGCDYEECRPLIYKNPVRTSQETQYVSATQPTRLMLCNI
jgi:hypothetical protein